MGFENWVGVHVRNLEGGGFFRHLENNFGKQVNDHKSFGNLSSL